MKIVIEDLTETTPRENMPLRDYSLTGVNARISLEKKLANADWYTTPISKEKMDELLTRDDGPGVRDCIIWFGLLFTFGMFGLLSWGTWWAVPTFLLYGVIYATTSDSRWHESSHGTAFKTPWMNDALYELASFMVFRESTPWRWSHARHHSDTIIMGRDPEIVVQRPTNLKGLMLSFFAFGGTWSSIKNMWTHAWGRMLDSEKCYVPESEYQKVFFKARIYLLIYVAVLLLSFSLGSILPLMFIGLPTFYGSWLMPIYGYTQHAGLAENVLDHRLNCRTVHMNFIHRYLYWNMGYHIEHHMFPMVPYHQLPKLHELMKADCPRAYTSLWEAWREIIPIVFLQAQNPNLYVKRELPASANPSDYRKGPEGLVAAAEADEDGWIKLKGKASSLANISRFDHEGQTFAIYKLAEGEWRATDGICTHGRAHLADGMLEGDQIECPKHNGRFKVSDGSCQRAPVCVPLKTYLVKEEGDELFLNIRTQERKVRSPSRMNWKVISNNFLTSTIKELVLERHGDEAFDYEPGQYMIFEIPPYGELQLEGLDGLPSGDGVTLVAGPNHHQISRTYSMASHPKLEKELKFNIRLAYSPKGQGLPLGVGSSYMFHLKPGDEVRSLGVSGDFKINPGDAEMLYIGGGAGMAPLKSHLKDLLGNESSNRKISYWYGARTPRDLFYMEELQAWAEDHLNFEFHVALSDLSEEDDWNGERGMIHEVVKDRFLEQHPDPKSLEIYLCGPPVMCEAVVGMLKRFGVRECQIRKDEF